MKVKGPRYWQQTISGSPAGTSALAALYISGLLPVQLQRWALSYIQDPSGVRGLLSQAFDEVRSLACTQARDLSCASRCLLLCGSPCPFATCCLDQVAAWREGACIQRMIAKLSCHRSAPENGALPCREQRQRRRALTLCSCAPSLPVTPLSWLLQSSCSQVGAQPSSSVCVGCSMACDSFG